MLYGTLTLLAIVFVGVRFALSRLHPAWWGKRWIRAGTWGALVLAVAGTMLRTLARSGWAPGSRATDGQHAELAIVGVAIASPAIVALLGLFVSLPLAALVRAAGGALARRAPAAPDQARSPALEALATVEPPATLARSRGEAAPGPEPPTTTAADAALVIPRRPIIELAAAAVPIAFLGAGAAGVAGALSATRIVPRRMAFRDLPRDLEGLRILQLTDLHVGAFMDPRGVEAIALAARPHAPDLVVLTGDICDHLPWLGSTLAAVAALRPRLGVLAALGNHEHYRGRGASIRGYERSGVDLLLDEHRVVKVGDAALVVAGVDDPARRRREGHYRAAIGRALDGAPSDAFRLGLCHRPSGFSDLARAGVDLTLSGHTHAGQIGLGDHSAFERLAPEARLWGAYREGDAQLYTSSGGGHWFAFRLNCPSEAALIVLERA
jgi:predicted MPP superfamily phosphohydrolase